MALPLFAAESSGRATLAPRRQGILETAIMASGRDWRDIENDKEKYAAYLCSREWGLLKEAVRDRAGGKCERCNILPIDATHHLTYARKYQENLEDLQGICNTCHKFTHGKDDFDPLNRANLVRYMVYCKSLPKMAMPYELANGYLRPFDLKPEFATSLMACDAINAEVDRLGELDDYLDRARYDYHAYALISSLELTAHEIEANARLPFHVGNWRGEFKSMASDYNKAARIVGVKIAEINDYALLPLNSGTDGGF